jgi:glyoxylase-like metal-dependent hydrolase (beta-lactamase superfamily II)
MPNARIDTKEQAEPNDDVAAKAPELRRLSTADEAWKTRGVGQRLDAVRHAAHQVRREIADGPRVVSVRTLPIVRAPYGTKFAFRGAAWSIAPYVLLDHHALLVQFMQNGALKTLLFNPTDTDGARNAPYFAKIAKTTPKVIEELLSPKLPTLEAQLADFGIAFEDVDYVAYDHLHVQDLRPIVGTTDGKFRARFPNAKVIVPSVEWHDWARLHPIQKAFYVEKGRENVDTKNVVFTDGDLALGDGVFLMRSPGHTSGNQTLFVATDKGIWGVSENGVCADNWAPLDSKIPGLRAYAAHNELDLVMNMNTPESGADQYTSMILERVIVDRVPHAPAFVQMFPSSEALDTALAPGLSPTIRFDRLTIGDVAKKSSRDREQRDVAPGFRKAGAPTAS